MKMSERIKCKMLPAKPMALISLRLPDHLICVVWMLGVTATLGGASSVKAPSRWCDVDQRRAPERIFALEDEKHGWLEYKNIANVPELQLGSGQAAKVWLGKHSSLLIAMYEPGEDFDAYSDYCFSGDGRLVQLKYELRTAWGWGYRSEGFASHDDFASQSVQFFSTHTGKQISKPRDADDIAEALKPSIYSSVQKMPFAMLLGRK